MLPIDFRNETFEQLRARLAGLRLAVWQAWHTYGPATTRQAAQRSGIDILTFRPRSTELYQLGAIVLVESEECKVQNESGTLHSALSTHHSHEGVYRARTEREWREWQAAQQMEAESKQMQLI